MSDYDVIVAGVGGMGSAAAFHLARRGARVLGIEQFGIPHDRGSSHGLTRIIRLAYWEDLAYVPLLRHAYELWRELEQVSSESLLVITGSVDAGEPDSRPIRGVLDACAQFDLRHEVLAGGPLAARFPGYRLPDPLVGVFQPDGGFLLSERCIAAHADAAAQRGAELHTNERILGWDTLPDHIVVRTDRAAYTTRRLVVTAGPWAGKTLRAMAPLVRVERQVVMWVRPLVPHYFLPERFPVFYLHGDEGSFYGFPLHGEHGMKIGKYHHLRQVVDPDMVDREVHDEDEAPLRRAIRRYFPDADGPAVSFSTCLFTNTADEHFIIDAVPEQPGVFVAGGFSGHGYKFCSVVGEILADLALEGGTRHDISLFRLTRSNRRRSHDVE